MNTVESLINKLLFTTPNRTERTSWSLARRILRSACSRRMRSSQRSRRRRPSPLSLPYRTAGNLWDTRVSGGWDPHRDHGDGGRHRTHPYTGRQVTSETPVPAEDEILSEITETEVLTALTPIQAAGNLWYLGVLRGWDLHRDHGDGGRHRSHPHTGRKVTSEIRVFAEDEILTEITETEAVTALTPIQDGR